MKRTMSSMVESLDLSVKLLKEHPEYKNRITKYWTDFGKHFLARVKEAEKESGQKLTGDISFMSLINLMK